MSAGMGAGIAAWASGESTDAANWVTVPDRPALPSDWREQIVRRVSETLLVDSHEHLVEERDRLSAAHPRMAANDWSVVMGHYLESDLAVAGMPADDLRRFYAPGADPMEKWRILEPWWPLVRYTGYGQASAIAISELYGVDELNAETISKVQEGYERLVKPGFYKHILQEVARLDSVQVNSLSEPFRVSDWPEFMLQDISILGMHMGPAIQEFAGPTGIEVKDLADWSRVIDWWFATYGSAAVAVKSQAAYMRDLDYEDVTADEAAPVFARQIQGDEVSGDERKRLQDCLFWYCVRKAAEYDLPIKLHTGYYAGRDGMPLDRVGNNPASVSRLLQHAVKEVPGARFVLMHIGYPYYEELVSLAKQYSNCTVDMCWAWIINPAASVQFLKHALVTAPVNKVLTFGGDYLPVEPVVGHAAIARHGIARALVELVDEGWLSLGQALELVEPIMCGNGRALFRLAEKKARAAAGSEA